MPTLQTNRPSLTDADRGPVLPLIADVIPDHSRWLDAPNAALGGHSPREWIGTPEEERLRDMVLAYKYGVYS